MRGRVRPRVRIGGDGPGTVQGQSRDRPDTVPAGEERPVEAVDPPRADAANITPMPTDPYQLDDEQHDPGHERARQRAERIPEPVREHLARGIDLPGDHRILVGTASWTDPTITTGEVFYPAGVKTPEQRLRYYASRFPLVEVDSTYYAIPVARMAETWVERTPDHFTFDVKAHALMTRQPTEVARLPKDMREALPPELKAKARVYAEQLPPELLDEVWSRFLEAIAPLHASGKLGAVLLQFPRTFEPSRASADALRRARERLGEVTGAVELRNPAWVTGRLAERTFALLEELGLAYVIVDAPPGTASSMPPVVRVTSPELAVLRLHGRRSDRWEARNDPVSERYRYLYDREQLAGWADRLHDIIDVARLKQGVHVVHNNCHANYGTTNAAEIAELLVEADEERRRMGRAARALA